MSNGTAVGSQDNEQWVQVTASQGSIPRLDLGDPELSAWVTEKMEDVEELLRNDVASGADFVADKVAHLFEAGGKRFRPMFALLASQYGPEPGSLNVQRAGAIVEMTHLATLYHDDVMDEAEKRRGVESANHRWNNSVAILAGDILLAYTSRMMGQLGVETVQHFATTFEQLVTGQMRETVGPRGGDPVEHYLNVIREKTGVLIAAAGYLGALHSGADKQHIKAVERYGEAVGMVFQIVDDIIDIFSDSSQSGKTPGTDLREGVFTLPVLYALREEGEVGDELRARVTGPVADEDVPEIIALLERSGGRARAKQDIEHYLAEAENALSELPQNKVTEALRTLAQLTAGRVG
ncbi:MULTISPECIES: polyprenyl synthetase family protein [Corynebacterium]|uniref:polyprenyl synthetase family protein n=1 Tax=Corynebacterium TaxID=1716 RepID=UPI00124C1A4F|nr:MULTISPECIES: polyprenyl synthetase family protein [Corynebacterium]